MDFEALVVGRVGRIQPGCEGPPSRVAVEALAVWEGALVVEEVDGQLRGVAVVAVPGVGGLEGRWR